jgi:hypothetical protein
MAVKRRRASSHPAQIENRIDPAPKVIRRNNLVETELIEKTSSAPRPADKSPPSLPVSSTGSNESRFDGLFNRYFATHLS